VKKISNKLKYTASEKTQSFLFVLIGMSGKGKGRAGLIKTQSDCFIQVICYLKKISTSYLIIIIPNNCKKIKQKNTGAKKHNLKFIFLKSKISNFTRGILFFFTSIKLAKNNNQINKN